MKKKNLMLIYFLEGLGDQTPEKTTEMFRTGKREVRRSMLRKMLLRESGFDGEWKDETIEDIEDIKKNH